MTLLQKLEKALEYKGLKKDYAAFLSVKEEKDIEGVVNSLHGLIPKQNEPKKINLDDLLKTDPEASKEFDRRVSKAIDTYKSKKENQDPTKEKGKDDLDENNPILKMFKAMEEKIDQLASDKEMDGMKSRANKAFEDSKLPETWISRIDLKSEVSYEGQVAELKKEYDEIIQSAVNSSASQTGIPAGGNSEDSYFSDEDLNSILG